MTVGHLHVASTSALAPQIPRALIADDQPDILAALHLLLRGAGFQTTSVSSPDAVLAAIQHDDFDLVLMDLNYERDTTSGQEGLDLITKIHQLDRTLPMVVLTGWGSVDLAVEAMHRGVRDFVLKPWDNSQLVRSLRIQIEEGRRRRRHRRLLVERRKANATRRHELTEAREIQQALLPKQLPQIKGLDIAVAWKPAQAVGGDYFDVIKFNERYSAICIADVAGKGTPAALLMSNFQAVLKSLAAEGNDPGEFCARVNHIIFENIVVQRFISCFYGIFDSETKTFSYVNAGHCPPMLLRDGDCVRLKDGGPVFGVFAEHDYERRDVTLRAGDRLVLFTDGVTETRDSAGIEFGESRLLEVLVRARELRSSELRDRIFRMVSEFSNGLIHDDATLMVLSVD